MPPARVHSVIGTPSMGSPPGNRTAIFFTDAGGAENFAHASFVPGSKSLL